MNRQRLLVLSAVVVFFLFFTVAVYWYVTLREPRVTSLSEGEVAQEEERFIKSLPPVVIAQEEEATNVPLFYRDCKRDEFDAEVFRRQLQSKAPSFALLRVSLGDQPVTNLDGEVIRIEETYDNAISALVLIAQQFELDPRLLATLIELESRGLSQPYNEPRFPLSYPDIAEQGDEFQIQVGIAADTIQKSIIELTDNIALVDDQAVTAQSVLEYFVGKGYVLPRIIEFTSPIDQTGFVKIFQSYFETDPRICAN